MSQIKARAPRESQNISMLHRASPKRLVAVVEDDAGVRNSLEFALEVEGYEQCLFENAQTAIDSLEILSVDCLVIDYALPDMDGLAMLEILRRRGLTAPAIVIASLPTARCHREAERAGVLLIEKPLMGETLQDVLRRIFAEAATANPA